MTYLRLDSVFLGDDLAQESDSESDVGARVRDIRGVRHLRRDDTRRAQPVAAGLLIRASGVVVTPCHEIRRV